MNHNKIIRLAVKMTAAAIAAALLLCVTGCPKKNNASATLRLSGILGDSARGDIYRGTLSEFSVEHPSVYLRDKTTAPEDAFKLELNIEGTYSVSDSPHIVYYYNNDDMKELSDIFVSVQEIREDNPDFLSQLSEGAIESAAWDDGGTYCIPVMADWYAVAVNRNILLNYGLDTPSSWDELLHAVDILSANSVIPFANTAENSSIIIESLIRYTGGQDALKRGMSGESYTINSVWAEALGYYQTLCMHNAFAPSAFSGTLGQYTSPPILYDSVLGADRDKSRRLDPVGLFASRKAAMLALDRETFMSLSDTEGIVLIDLPDPLGNSEDEIMPAVSDNAATDDALAETKPTRKIYGGFNEGFYITRKGYSDPALRALILELIERLTGVDNQSRFASMGYIPSNTSVSASIPQLSAITADAAAGARFVRSYIGAPNTSRWSYIQQCAVQLWYGLITPRQMTELLCEENKNTIDILEQIQEQAQAEAEAEAEEEADVTVSPADISSPSDA